VAANRSSLIAAFLASVLLVALVVAPWPIAVAQGNSAADGASGPEINLPADRECALKVGTDVVTFSGGVPAGSTLVKVVFRDFDADHNQLIERDITGRNQVSIDPDGNVSGSTFVGGKDFDAQSVAWVRAALTVDSGGATSEWVTSKLPFDRVRPTYAGVRTTGAKTLVVRFSENVKNVEGDFAADWFVDGEPAAKISGEGASRTLELGLKSLGEDALPTVKYDPLPSHGGYHDCADNQLSVEAGLTRVATDDIAPKIPNIKTIADKSATSAVASRDDTPSVVVDGATNGHRIALYRESTITPSFNPNEDTQLGEPVTVAGGQASFADIPSFGDDGTYTLYAIAIDANGNRSRDQGGNVAADAATFKLDRVAPEVRDARTTGARSHRRWRQPRRVDHHRLPRRLHHQWGDRQWRHPRAGDPDRRLRAERGDRFVDETGFGGLRRHRG
jgi:hypothetical protein